MKTVIIIAVCVVAYLLIGFGVLVVRASRDWIDNNDTVLALLFWPVVLLVCAFYYATEGIKNSAQKLGFKLEKRMKK